MRLANVDIYAAPSSQSQCLYPISQSNRIVQGLVPQLLYFSMLGAIFVCRAFLHCWRLRRGETDEQPATKALPPRPQLDLQAESVPTRRLDLETRSWNFIRSITFFPASNAPERQNGSPSGADADLLRTGDIHHIQHRCSWVFPILRSALALYIFTYNITTNTVLQYFSCVDVDFQQTRLSLMYYFPAVDCASSERTRWMVLIVLVLAIEVIAIPILLFYVMMRNRLDAPPSNSSTVSNPFERWRGGRNGWYFQTLRYLSIGFRDRVFWWEFVLTARRLLIVSVSVFVVDTYQRSCAQVIIHMLALLLHVFFMPFISVQENVAEIVSLFMLIVLSLMLTLQTFPPTGSHAQSVGVFAFCWAIFFIVWCSVYKTKRIHDFLKRSFEVFQKKKAKRLSMSQQEGPAYGKDYLERGRDTIFLLQRAMRSYLIV